MHHCDIYKKKRDKKITNEEEEEEEEEEEDTWTRQPKMQKQTHTKGREKKNRN